MSTGLEGLLLLHDTALNADSSSSSSSSSASSEGDVSRPFTRALTSKVFASYDCNSEFTSPSIRSSPCPTAGKVKANNQPKKASHRMVHVKPASATHKVAKSAKLRDLKARALRVPCASNVPASTQQRMLMRTVFDDITPYPDDAWMSHMAILTKRNYKQVKNWFSNQRQKEAKPEAENRGARLSLGSDCTIEDSLVDISCDGRTLRVRNTSAECLSEEGWTDDDFVQVLMVMNFKIVCELSNGFQRKP